MNRFIFSGNLTKDAQVSTTKSGKTVCSFTVAVNSGYGDNQKADFIQCALWGKRAEGGLPPYLVKGQKVLISGEASLNQWEGEKGPGAAIRVMVDDLDLIGEKKAHQNENQAASQAADDDDFGDSIPF